MSNTKTYVTSMDLARENSKWHFSPSIQSHDFSRVGRFLGDWAPNLAGLDSLLTAREKYTPISIGKRKRLYGGGPTPILKNELEDWGYPTDYVFCSTAILDPLLGEGQAAFISSLLQLSGLGKPSAVLIKQLPGQMLPWHCDLFHTYRSTVSVKPDETVVRYLVAMEAWDWGHYLAIGNSVWHQWECGEAISWPYLMYHGSANCGRSPKFTLSITGVESDAAIHRKPFTTYHVETSLREAQAKF
ncbi:MAG: hypothetical protein SFY81_10745 [Verrucomicrobiota bacterium]|nr:hypothetical protein [Verrucomicrobiota bacterium]